jgi:hypothetical protein
MTWLRPIGIGLRACGDALLAILVWTLWLALSILLITQLVIAFSHEFAVPGFVLRRLEERFIASHLQARFGRATFDPSGRVLLENLHLSLPEFAEPIVDVRAVYIELDPWLLLAGQVNAKRVHATGVKIYVPAMLAPSGRSEDMVDDLELMVSPQHPFKIETLTARIAGVAVEVHGTIELPRSSQARGATPFPLLGQLATHYADFSRQLIRGAEKLTVFTQPELNIRLEPSTSRGAIAQVQLTARELTIPGKLPIHANEVSLQTSAPLLGDAPTAAPVSINAKSATLGEANVTELQAWLDGAVSPARFTYEPLDVRMTADEIGAEGITVGSVSAVIDPTKRPALKGRLVANLAGERVAIEGSANFSEKTADAQITGALSPTLLDSIEKRLGRDLRHFVDFGQPVALDARVRFGPGGKFENLNGYVDARKILAHGVAMDSVAGHFDFDGRRFFARDAIARLGENYARGSFEQDLHTKDFRFLLAGRLRPLDISGWFHAWWPRFFQHLEFPFAPPDASVDVAGRWGYGLETTVFVFAENRQPVIRGAKLDYVRTRLFIRPNFFDGLELFGTRGAGDVRGTFIYKVDVKEHELNQLTFEGASTIDLPTGATLLGANFAAMVQPFSFETPPHLKFDGVIDGPASPNGAHRQLNVEALSTGVFSAYRFSGQHLTFKAKLHDDDLLLDPLNIQVASGVLAGTAHVWGVGADRKLGFNASVHDANLGQAISTVLEYAARRRGQSKKAEADKFLSGKNNAKFDINLAAEGRLNDPYSYHGVGHANIAGAELGEVRLLGLLSELLNFTALRFTAVSADFTVEGAKLVFPSVTVTGANSAIQAHGTYALERRDLDFNARVYPFQESKSFLQSVVGVVLTPLSAALEVKLTGPLDQPKWAFVIGPTNLLRNLSGPNEPKTSDPKAVETDSPPPAQRPETPAPKP